MRIRKLRELSLGDFLAVGIPALLLASAGFWFAAQFIKPAPPDRLVFTTGGEGGAYQYYAARYKQLLERFGIRLVERPSAGSIENLARLADPNADVDAGFIQTGTVTDPDQYSLESLGAIYYEPVWVFYRGPPGHRRLEHLAGKRIAIGPEGSGTRKLALELLHRHGMAGSASRLSPLSGLQAVEAIRRGEIEAVITVGTLHSATVWLLLHTEGISLASFEQADAYARHFPYLSVLTLPRGAVSFVRDIPPHDVRMIAPTASVVVRKDTHPALVDLLLQAMREVHREHGAFQNARQFPNGGETDFPLADRAERFYRSGPPFLQRYLPFWVANFVDRVMVLLVPLVALLVPLIKITPPLYSWRVRSRIYRWYGELKHIEVEAARDPRARSRDEWLEAIQKIENEVNRIRTPLAFADFLYTLRLHIAFVREQLVRRVQFLDDESQGGRAPDARSR